jgi:glycerol-3-phosphate acyltransferase PlsY
MLPFIVEQNRALAMGNSSPSSNPRKDVFSIDPIPGYTPTKRLNMILNILLLAFAYMIGSIPTALVMGRRLAGVDVRQTGDGNMGARNVSRTFGTRAGVLVALVDFAKGALPVALTASLGYPLSWQMAAGVCAVLGHDFPLFAKFAGGQGLSTTCGVFFVLLPLETSIGMLLWAVLYALTHHPDFSAGVGLGFTLTLAVFLDRPWFLLVYIAGMFLFIPVKMLLDAPRRERIRQRTENPPVRENPSKPTS